MEQTYKVFFNNRILYVGGQTMPAIPTCTASQKYTNSAELQLFINEFKAAPHLHQALVYGMEVEALFHEVKSMFKCIEAAGGVVRNGFGELLFIHRLGVWDLPKGKMEKGEKPDETAIREVMEECGIDNLSITHKITDTYHTYEHKGKHVLKRTHWYAMSVDGRPNPTPQTEEDITHVCWKSRWDDVLENTYPSIADVLGMGF
jgi:ADP-ribose pyrophosphatase YjhB (NUDIX family)